MTDDQVFAYVHANAAMLGLALDGPRAQAVAVHLARTVQLADVLQQVPMPVDNEIAEIYCPLPFPLSDPMVDAP